MRIGDVGTVSHVGDLLAFSLAVMLVLSLVYSIETREDLDKEDPGFDWVLTMVTIRSWEGFDPDDDSVLEVDITSTKDRIKDIDFPVEGEVTVTFRLEGQDLKFHFNDGEYNGSVPSMTLLAPIHGCVVFVEVGDSVIPSLMEVSIKGVEHS